METFDISMVYFVKIAQSLNNNNLFEDLSKKALSFHVVWMRLLHVFAIELVSEFGMKIVMKKFIRSRISANEIPRIRLILWMRNVN